MVLIDIMNLKEIVYSKVVVEFATVARVYCQFIEEMGSDKPQEFVATCQKMLPLLYFKTSLLPSTTAVYDGDNEVFVSELDYAQVDSKISKLLGAHNDFLVVEACQNGSTEDYQNATISEYMADIYQDLKNFIGRYHLGNEQIMNDAIWECYANYQEYWGLRLAILIKEFHSLRYGSTDFDANDSNPPAGHNGNQPCGLEGYFSQSN